LIITNGNIEKSDMLDVIFCGRLLDEKKTIEDYNIENCTCVFVKEKRRL
jgi:hypothetical protein